MTANSQLLTTTPETKTKTNSANNQNRNRTTEMEITWRVINRGVGGGGKVQRISSINGRQKIDRGRVKIVWEMQKPKNLYVWPMDMNYSGGMWEGEGGQDGVE